MRQRALIMLIAACAAAMLPWTAFAQTARDGKMRILGRASIEVTPDYALVRVGISTKAATPTVALDQNSAIARRMIDFSKRFGINEQDLTTESVNLAPVSRNVRDASGNNRQEPDGYSANNTLRAKLTDLSRIGLFMRQILEQGATNISGVQFGVSDPEKIADAARNKAVEDALRQARGMAEAARVKLGSIQEIVHPPRVQYQPADGFADMPVLRQRRMNVPIEVGTVTIAVEVDITWTIE
jgi:uncharacterized protein YggE